MRVFGSGKTPVIILPHQTDHNYDQESSVVISLNSFLHLLLAHSGPELGKKPKTLISATAGIGMVYKLQE